MKNERQFKGVLIDAETFLRTDLCPGEKMLLADIDSFTGNGSAFYKSNATVASFLKCSQRQVTRYIEHLLDLKLIEVAGFDGRKRYLKSASTKKDKQHRHSVQADTTPCPTENNTNEKNIEKVAADPAFTRCVRFFYDKHRNVYSVPPKWGGKEATLLKADIERLKTVGAELGEDWQAIFETFVLGFLKNGISDKMATFADSAGHGYNVFHGLLEQMIYDFVQFRNGG